MCCTLYDGHCRKRRVICCVTELRSLGQLDPRHTSFKRVEPGVSMRAAFFSSRCSDREDSWRRAMDALEDAEDESDSIGAQLRAF